MVKARHSTFYETPLEYLLDQMGVGGDRDRRGGGDLRGPRRGALKMMERNMGAELGRPAEIDLGRPPALAV